MFEIDLEPKSSTFDIDFEPRPAGAILVTPGPPGPPGETGETGDPGRGYTDVSISGNNIVFTATSSPATETLPVPALAAADAAASTATAKAVEASQAADAATSRVYEAQGYAEAAGDYAEAADLSAAAAAQSARDAEAVIIDEIPNASPTAKGGIVLAGDLGGTYDSPTVPGLATKVTADQAEAIAQAILTSWVGAAPAQLDTLTELAAALGNDPNFASTLTAALAGKAAISHTHAMEHVTGLVAALSGKAPTVHTHTVENVTGLVTALNGKADLSEGGRVPAAQLASAGTDGQVLAKTGTGAQWIDPPEGGGLPSIPDGPLAVASTSYKSAATAAKAGTGQLRVLTLGDSTCDGYIGGLPGGPTKWSDTWPNLLAAKLRTAWGLPAGGTGWLPLRHENAVAGDYSFPQSTSSDGYWSPVVGDTGIAGSQWMVPRSEGGRRVTVPLEPGLTSVEVLSTAWAGNHAVGLYPQLGTSIGVPHNGTYIARTSAPTPGGSIGIESVGSGWQGLGAVGYAGDETRGVISYNWGVAGISAAEVSNRLVLEECQETLSAIAPHVVLVCLGANDYGDRSVAQVRASFAAIHTALTTATPGVQVVFVVRPLASAAWAAYADGILAEAAARGAHGLDLRPLIPASASGVYTSDGVHLTLAGNVAYAEAVAAYLALGSEGITTDVVSDMTAIGRQLARVTSAAEVRQIAGIGIVPVRVTQAQYNALPTPRDPNVLYLVKG